MIGRVLVTCGQTVSAVFVKISAVASRVIENTVKDDTDTMLCQSAGGVTGDLCYAGLACVKTIKGQGLDGYRQAILYLKEHYGA